VRDADIVDWRARRISRQNAKFDWSVNFMPYP
jgi:hypothetical protein